MSDVERSPERPPWASRVVGWADGYVKKWALILWTLGATGGGLAGGLLVGHVGNPDWVEAAGTWAGVFVGAGVGVVAYRAFIRETYDRTVDRHSDLVRRAEERELEEQRQYADAQRVEIWVGHGGATNTRTDEAGIEWQRALGVKLGVINRSQAQAVNVVVIFSNPIDYSVFTRGWLRVDGPGHESETVRLDGDKQFDFPRHTGEAAAFFAKHVTMQFEMHGRRWTRHGRGPAEERVDRDAG